MKNKKGFTLVEIVVVLVVLGILARVGVASFTGYAFQANEIKVMSDILVAEGKLGLSILSDGYDFASSPAASIDQTALNALIGEKSLFNIEGFVYKDEVPTGNYKIITNAEVGGITDGFDGDVYVNQDGKIYYLANIPYVEEGR